MLELHLEVAEQYPGTAEAAESLLQAAMMASLEGDSARYRELHQEVIDRFPGTGYEIFARKVLEVKRGTLEETMSTLSAIGVRFGAPSIEQILAPGDQTELIKQVTALHPEIRYAIGKLYGITSVFRRYDRFDDALRLASFGRQAFDPVAHLGDSGYAGSIKQLGSLSWNFFALRGQGA